MKPSHILMLVLVAAAWGFNFVIIKLGLKDLPPILFSALRFSFAAVPLVFFIKKPQVPWRIIIGIGLVLGVVKFSLLFIGMDIGVSAGLASLLLQSQAFFTVILAMLLYGERPPPLQYAGILIAFLGMALIAGTVDQSFTLTGLALVLAAGLAWACSNMLMKKAGQVDMLQLMVWVSLIPPLPLLAISLAFEGPGHAVEALTNMTWTGAGAVAYIAYIATIFGFAIWGQMIRRYSAAIVAPFSLLVPVFGMTSSALVLGEAFGPLRIFGAGIVVCGLILTVYNPKRMVALSA
jgi:O-acetylserine/cysteine efflux transporter